VDISSVQVTLNHHASPPFETVEYSGNFFPEGLPQDFFSRGVQQIQLRTVDRENGDLGAVSPYSRVTLNFQVNEALF
jgi:hypothetical protein